MLPGSSSITYVGVSTKMYLGYPASLRWLERVREVVDSRPALTGDGPVQVFVIPSFPVLESAARILAGSPVRIGAQNCSWADGPLTGEVSAGMLAELGVSLVEIGHAERRALFAEDDAMVARKVAAAWDAGITPLLCIGEQTRTTTTAAALECVGQVLAAGADGTNTDPTSRPLLLAYEPIWAIGADSPADPGYIDDVVAEIRSVLEERTGVRHKILYGGSAGPGLLPRLAAVNGLFLGRFAHDPANLGTVIDEALAAAAAGGAGA